MTLLLNQELDLSLQPGQVLALNGDERGVQLVCSVGRLWVTQADDQEDYMLSGGDKFVVSKPGTVVVQAVRQGKLRLVPATN